MVYDHAVDLRTDRPYTARVYDYILGGNHNYPADREAGEAVRKLWPAVSVATRANREFMHRATRYLAAHGVTQFLDIGSGIPTRPNLHEVAQEIAPQSRVAYVDNDPIVLAEAAPLLAGTAAGRTAYIPADATAPDTILNSSQLHQTLDLSRPLALSMVGLLPFIPDEQRPYDMVAALVKAVVPGSYLVMSHITADFDPVAIAEVTRVYHDGGLPLRPRSRAEFARFFHGLELLDPGIVPAQRWRRDDSESDAGSDAQVSVYAAVARKPQSLPLPRGVHQSASKSSP